MNKLGPFLLFFFFVSGARARAQDSEGPERLPFAAVDRELNRAEGELTELRMTGSAAAARDAAVCRGGFSVQRVVRAVDGRALPAWVQPVSYDFIRDSLEYYQCRAFALDDPSECEPLTQLNLPFKTGTGTDDPDHWSMACLGHYNEMKLVRSYAARSPDFSKICPPTLMLTEKSEEPEFRQNDIAQVCRIISDRERSVASVCAALEPLFTKPKLARRCVPTLRRLQGDPGACDHYKIPEVDHRCRDYALFRRAHEAGRLSVCGARPVCRILMGAGAKECAAYAGQIEDLLCAAPAARWARAEAALTKARLQLASSSSAAGAGERRARLGALAEKLAGLAREFAAKP